MRGYDLAEICYSSSLKYSSMRAQQLLEHLVHVAVGDLSRRRRRVAAAAEGLQNDLYVDVARWSGRR